MNCQICGKPSGFFPLCKDCNEVKEIGKIIKCENCGKWHYANKPCPECKQIETKAKKRIEQFLATRDEYTKPSVEPSNELTCIICGENSNGKHFCKKCYAKYKDRSVDIRITHCNETEILDEYGNLQYKCDDGRKVRSRAEKIISDFFFKERVRAVYEETIYYSENGENKTLHPDFFLPDYDMYIEYNELKNKPYLNSKDYTQNIYKKLNKKVLIIDDNDLHDIAACLKPKLGLH